MSNIEPERDWEAEFQAIAERLGVEIDDAPKASGVNRHIVPTGPDAAALDDLPWGRAHETPSNDSPTSHTGERTPSSAAPADDRPSADEHSRSYPVPGSSPVPGFRPEWRLADPPAQPDRNAPAHDDELDDEGTESFVEPDPRPLDLSDPSVVIMVAALVLGPLWLVYLVFFHRDAPTLWWAAGAGVTVAGFVLAVVRQPRSRDEDDPDDGARV